MTTVLKFGGTSLSSVARLNAAARLVAEYAAEGDAAVVVSAMGHTTDDLVGLAGALNSGPGSRESDQLIATGEVVAAAGLALALSSLGIRACSLTAAQAGILVEGAHGEGRIARIDVERLRRLLDDGVVPVVVGFQGVDEHGDVITLGRGGSDTTAVALAASLGASSCVIFSDVPGVSSADPRVVPYAHPRRRISAEVMGEMAFSGSRVLHPRAVELATAHGLYVQLRSALEPDQPGTVVTASPHRIAGAADPDGSRDRTGPAGWTTGLESLGPVGVAHDCDVARVLIHGPSTASDGLPAEVLSALARAASPIDLVARSSPIETEFRMGFTMREADLVRARAGLHAVTRAAGATFEIDISVGKVSLIGHGLASRPEMAARMLSVLARHGVATSWVSITMMRISAVVPRGRIDEVACLLHAEFALTSLAREVVLS